MSSTYRVQIYCLGLMVFLVGMVVVWIPTAKADSPALRELRARVEALEAQAVDISVRVFNSADIPILHQQVVTTLTFNMERWDTDGIHDPNDSRLTAQTAGKYYIFAHITWRAVGVGGGRRLGILLNGATVIAEEHETGGPTSMSVSTHYELDVDDYVEVQVEQGSGNAVDILSVEAMSPEFGMVKLP